MMNRDEAINVIVAARGDAAIVVGPGANSGLMFARADAPASIYNMDLGYTTPVALGIALARPRRKVLAIEGDGSFYAGSTALSTVWRMQPANLIVIVVDNGVWGTGDGKEPTATSCGVNLARLALAAGWREDHVREVDEAPLFGSALGKALDAPGPHFIVARTDPGRDQFLLSSSRRGMPPVRHQVDCVVLTAMDLARDV
jgi:thiamine pyrophosphate-dependent acetolactate synthase large subunit-like protein